MADYESKSYGKSRREVYTERFSLNIDEGEVHVLLGPMGRENNPY